MTRCRPSSFAVALLAGTLVLTLEPRARAATPSEDLAVVMTERGNTCSAFLVRPDTFLTAKHCLVPPGETTARALPQIYADRGDGSRDPARLQVADAWSAPGVWHDDFDIDGQDFAVLKLARPYAEAVPDVEPLRVYAGDPSTLVGEDVELIGFGFEDGHYARRHAFGRIREVAATVVVEPGIACPGDSGGVLLRASTREAIGIASREWQLGSNPCAPNSHPAETSIFQRIDTHVRLIDGPNGPPEPEARDVQEPRAPPAETNSAVVSTTGCSASPDRRSGVAALLLFGVAFAARRRLRART